MAPRNKSTTTNRGRLVTGTGSNRDNTRKREARQRGARTSRSTGSPDRMTRGDGVSRYQRQSRPGLAGGSLRVTESGSSGFNQGSAERVTQGRGRVPVMERVRQLLSPLSIIRMGRFSPFAAELLSPAGVADGGVEGKPSRPNNQKPKAKPKPKRQSLSPGAKSFDKAFANARAAGKSSFTWRGKSYNTKYKGE